MSHVLHVLLSLLLHAHTGLPNSYNTCTVGLSCVIFSLKYVPSGRPSCVFAMAPAAAPAAAAAVGENTTNPSLSLPADAGT